MTLRSLPIGLAVALAAACGAPAPKASDPCADGGAPNDLPSSCPTPEPSYVHDVAPLLAARCNACHSPGGLSPSWSFTTYAEVYRYRSDLLDQVYACKMPSPGVTPLDEAERRTLLGWLVCGAPAN